MMMTTMYVDKDDADSDEDDADDGNLHPKTAEFSCWSLTHVAQVLVQLLCFAQTRFYKEY